jgi:hypothetical protein
MTAANDSGVMEQVTSTVRLDVPAQQRSLRLLRLAAADAAGDLGFGVDRVESARIAVDELCAILIEAGSGDRLDVSLIREDGLLTVEGSIATATSTAPELDRIVSELLDVCAKSWSLDVGESRLVFRLVVGP